MGVGERVDGSRRVARQVPVRERGGGGNALIN